MKGSGEPEGGLRSSMLTMEVPVPQHDKMIVKIILFLLMSEIENDSVCEELRRYFANIRVVTPN